MARTLKFRDRNGRFRSIRERTLEQIWDYLFRYLDRPWKSLEYIPNSQYVDPRTGDVYASFKSKLDGGVSKLPIADHYEYMNELGEERK